MKCSMLDNDCTMIVHWLYNDCTTTCIMYIVQCTCISCSCEIVVFSLHLLNETIYKTKDELIPPELLEISTLFSLEQGGTGWANTSGATRDKHIVQFRTGRYRF